ncbi:unnamed protein product [Effrenium voratum]|nr:unnamed protein product [Effrenium voratum]
MFIFGGSGNSPAQEDPQRLLAERDEEIEELKAKIEALRDALEKEPHFDHFEMAMDEKNKVLEELRKENMALTERLAQAQSSEPAEPAPEAARPEALSAGAAPEPQEAAISTEAEALQGQLALAVQELEELRASSAVEEASKVRTENMELRARLAHAIYCTTETQQALAAQSGQPVESVQEFHLAIENNDLPVGAMFAPRESRQLGRGWQVARVRENTWAEQNGVQPGDELHYINGHPIEVLPEAEVMDLLALRPVTLTWLRRQVPEVTEKPQAEPETETETVATQAGVEELQAQNQALQDQLQRLSLELGKVQAGEPGDADKLAALPKDTSLRAEAEAAKVEELELELANSRQLQEQLAMSMDVLKAELEQSRAHAADLEAAKLQESEAARQKLQEQVDESESATQLQALQEQLSTSLARVSDLEAELAHKDDAVAAARSSMEEMQAHSTEEIGQLKAQLTQAQQQSQLDDLKVGTFIRAHAGASGGVGQAELEAKTTELQELQLRQGENQEDRIAELEAKLEEASDMEDIVKMLQDGQSGWMLQGPKLLQPERSSSDLQSAARCAEAEEQLEALRQAELLDCEAVRDFRGSCTGLSPDHAVIFEPILGMSQEAVPADAAAVRAAKSGSGDGWDDFGFDEPQEPKLEESSDPQLQAQLADKAQEAVQLRAELDASKAAAAQLEARVAELQLELGRKRVASADSGGSGWGDFELGDSAPAVPNGEDELVKSLQEQLATAVAEASRYKSAHEELAQKEAEVSQLKSQLEAAQQGAGKPRGGSDGWDDFDFDHQAGTEPPELQAHGLELQELQLANETLQNQSQSKIADLEAKIAQEASDKEDKLRMMQASGEDDKEKIRMLQEMRLDKFLQPRKGATIGWARQEQLDAAATASSAVRAEQQPLS